VYTSCMLRGALHFFNDIFFCLSIKKRENMLDPFQKEKV
jgi:hypothetical protein